MKRLYCLGIFLAMSAVFAAGLVAARDREPWGPGRGHNRDRMQGPRYAAPESPEKVTVSGPLGLDKGRIVLQKDDETYIVMGLSRLVGFVDGLKEGAAVTLEGFIRPSPSAAKLRYLLVNKLTINGREYDDLLRDFGFGYTGSTGTE